MKVLHLCSYYTTSSLYRELFAAIQRPGISQIVFVPTRGRCRAALGSTEGIALQHAPVLGWRHRLLYGRKIRVVAREVHKRLDLNGVDVVHAHSLFSDGGAAYLLKRRYAIRYVAAVRSTDLNVFIKWAPYLLPFACEVLAHADRVIFISPAYREKLLRKLPLRVRDKVEERSLVIPNGVHSFWQDHSSPEGRRSPSAKLGLIQVGTLIARKNVRASIEAAASLKREGFNVQLIIVGDGPEKQKLRQLCTRLNLVPDVIFHGHVHDREMLRALLQTSDILLLPSWGETFGLVLPEAMSQGLPLIYTRGEGFDGFFRDGHVGYGIHLHDPLAIPDAVKKILADYSSISRRCLSEVQAFNWTGIADRYAEFYSSGATECVDGGRVIR